MGHHVRESARLYQLEMDGVLPRGSGQPLWWTLRRPFRPLT